MNKKKWATIALAILSLLVAVSYSCSAGNGKHYLIARDDTWYPIDLHGKAKNMLGFSNDLIEAIASTETIRIDLVQVRGNNNLQNGLDKHFYDGMLFALPLTAENLHYYYFSEPFFRFGPVLVVTENSPISSLQDMQGKSVGIIAGSSVVFDVEEYPSILITSYDNDTQALISLENGYVDGIILDVQTAYSYETGLYADLIRIVTSPLTSDAFRLVTIKDQKRKELIEYFNHGLKELQSNGTLEELFKKWDLPFIPKSP